jgi:uncharacterized protein (TIGR03435 family)
MVKSYLPANPVMSTTGVIEAGRKPDVVGILVTALQGEPGLKLEARKESVDVLVIDHVDRPSDNQIR